MSSHLRSLLGVLLLTSPGQAAPSLTAPLSHPPLRPAPPAPTRPAVNGPAYYVDPEKGSDTADGSKAKPWRSVRHALIRLTPGDTLYLRGGVYYEPLYIAHSGRADAPITIRSAPGGTAIIDGSLPLFFNHPEEAWEPALDGVGGEYRSKRRYPNLRDIIGSFGDSMIGLNTYYHAKDLLASNEVVSPGAGKPKNDVDIDPLYCGPGVWYDRETGRIHARFSHTHSPEPVANYRGETDPRNLPLILAPFASVPLHLDGAKHVRIQDLVVRGAGYTTMILDHCDRVELENLTVWCGTYGLRATRTTNLKILGSRFHGSVPPWTSRADASKRDYPDRPLRNLTRMNTHAIIEIETGGESSVFATPQNDLWEIANCDFTDGHDAVYLGTINVHFHHNRIDNFQDDGIYLSPVYYRHKLVKVPPQIHVHENVITRVLTALAFGGPEPEDPDEVFIYRNIFDLRGSVYASRASVQKPTSTFLTGKVIGDHGSPPWPTLNFYHNTVLADGSRDALMGLGGSLRAGHPRRVFNNLLIHTDRLPVFPVPKVGLGELVTDANLYWAPNVTPATAKSFFDKFRKSDLFTASQKLYPPGSTTHSIVADPLFEALNDYRLKPTSPARDAGVKLPETWPDPQREADGKPDIGAVPIGGTMPR